MKGQKINYEDNHKEINGIVCKQCNRCEAWFPCTDEYFYKTNSTGGDGLFNYCKVCHKKKSTEYNREHPEMRKESNKKNHAKPHVKAKQKISNYKRLKSGKCKEWQQNNPEKLKQYHERYSNKKHKINKKEWESCKEYFNNTCAYCGLPIEEHYNKFNGELRLTDFHREHVNCNGSDDLSNCVPSCKECNTQKHTDSLEQWYNEKNLKFNQERLDKIHNWINEDYKLYMQ